MDRPTVITCDMCEQVVPVAAESWRNVDICQDCLGTARPVSEVLARIRQVADADGMYVGAADIIPERTRPRRPVK